jgi:soluble lytic murein transglycosylase-like protein
MYEKIILYISHYLGVPGSLLLAICTHESHLKNVVSPNDHGSPSYGICQIKEDTARDYGFDGKSSDLLNPYINVWYSAQYLYHQLDRYDFNWCMAAAAYNAGRYLPSKTEPGKPKNFKYVKGVTLYLDDKHKDMLICGPRKVASE